MIELKGKYNTAKIFTDNVDNETISQLITLLNQEFVKDSQIRIMPDTHAGKGCVIGTTMTIKDKIVPNLTGVDIGCGMLAIKLKEHKINMQILDNVINTYVPAGFDIHENPIATSNIDKIYAPVDVDKAYKSLGTLGGGNHFIEVDKDENDDLWLVIHTGSRHLGIEVCDYYQNLAYETLKNKAAGGDIKTLRKELIARLQGEGREKDISKELAKLNKEYKDSKVDIPYELAYLEGENMKNYLHDMALAQEHAKINRRTIADIILKKAKLHEIESFDTIHNYIDVENMILRKGSISAKFGEKVLIPINMRDGSLICIGKGNENFNFSAPHGAGRLMSRSKAKENISMRDFKASMDGIYTTSVDTSTLDEAPQAYKPMEEIMENIKDTVDVVSIIKPIYNFKAHDKVKVLELEQNADYER
jgi:RNA-splicing ligase RtcB